MKVINKSENILSYHLEKNFFDEIREIECGINGTGHWELANEDAFKYVYNLSYFAKDKASDDLFIDYKSIHVLTVIINNTDDAVMPTLGFIKESYNAMYSFITNNSFSYFEKLHMPEFQINDSRTEIIKGTIEQIKNIRYSTTNPPV